MLQTKYNKSSYMYFRLSDTTLIFTEPLVKHRFGSLKLDNNCSYIGIQNLSLIKYLGVKVEKKFKWS